MLSRAGQLTRLNSFIVRQFTTATSLSTKPTQLKEAAESESASNLDHSNSSDKTKKNFQNRPKTSKNFTNVKNYNNTNIKNYNNRNNNQQKYANNNESVAKNQSSNKYKPISNDTKKQFNLNAVSKELEYNPKHQETYKEAIYAIQTSSSNQNLIESCQKLNHLYDSDLKVAEQFNTDPIKPKVVKNILSNLDKMNTDEFITSANFISRFEPNKFDRLQRHITENLAKYNVGHLIKIVSMMRSLAYHKPEAMDMLRELTEKLRGRIDELDSVADAKRALKLFSHESSLVQRIDMRLSQLADKLTLDEWIELLNTKSILRQRNMSILEICAYNIVKLAQGESSKKVNLSLEQIQKCMLSCGILNYNEMSFYKFLLSQLNDTLSSAAQSTTKPTSSWLSENEQHLLAIITSLGMLQLRDENTLDTVCSLLKANRDRSKLIVSFVQTCGALNYTPKSSTDFAQIIASITESAFNLGDDRDRANFLNYVWSLCALNKADQYLIASVLEKKFFDSILNDKKAKDFKSNLLKILNINMHSMFRMDNYEGPNLPEDFNLAQYSELLAAKKNSHANETLISTLAGFRSINKYVKVNLLTSFGILIDAFMIVDKNGNPQPLDKYLSKDSPSEMTEDEMRVAFKLIGFKDQTLINKNINGIIMFQLSLLKEVGYHPVIVYQDELQSASLTNRVELIQKKLKELTKNKK